MPSISLSDWIILFYFILYYPIPGRSATMALYDDEQVTHRLSLWCSWHQHWVYGEPCAALLPAGMPLREDIEKPKRAEPQIPYAKPGDDWF